MDDWCSKTDPVGIQTMIEIPWFNADDDQEWWCQQKLGIRETRLLHNAIVNYLNQKLEEKQGRPPEERQFLDFQRNRLYAMIMDYNFNHNK